MDALGINLGYLLIQIASFIIMVLVLKAWVYNPLLILLETRRTTIAQGLEDARIAADARANAEKEAQKIIAEAQVKATQVVREATERAESAANDIKAASEAETAKAREAAKELGEQEKVRVLGDLRGQVAALAMAAAHMLIGDALSDDKRQRTLIEEFFSGVKAGKVTLLEDAKLSGSSAEVTSALTLTPAEQEAVKQDVLGKLGGQGNVAFRVDPSILGGLVVRVGDKVLDGSVSGKLTSMAEKLR